MLSILNCSLKFYFGTYFTKYTIKTLLLLLAMSLKLELISVRHLSA